MKKLTLILTVALSFVTMTAHARDDVNRYSIQELLITEKAKEVLNPDIQLFFGTQTTPKVEKTYGEVTTNKKTNAFMKSDREACEWVMLSALIALQDRAVAEGMNAVSGIESFYKKREFISETQFECGNGAIMAGVALKGTLVKI
ncbi:MAG: excinuclease ABC subunit A [Cognaticolwellia aestuarii]